MTILAHSQEEKIMPVKALTSGAPSQRILIFSGSDRWICLAPDPKNVRCGNGGVIKERFLRHPIVTLIAVGRNTSLIAETKDPFMPGVPVAGELAIHRPGGVPPAQAKMKFTALKNGNVGFSFNERNSISDEIGRVNNFWGHKSLHEPGRDQKMQLALAGLEVQQFDAGQRRLANLNRPGILNSQHRGDRLAKIGFMANQQDRG
jgi:hypothetical protein